MKAERKEIERMKIKFIEEFGSECEICDSDCSCHNHFRSKESKDLDDSGASNVDEVS